MGYGHVAALPSETQLAEGLGGGGPAVGCEGSPAASYAVTSSSRKAVNIANLARDLTLSGVSQDASAVSVSLEDKSGKTVSVPATLSGTPSAQSWTATIPASEVATLSDGMLSASGSYTLPEATISGANLKVLKDTVAPKLPKATPRAGTYHRTQLVSLETNSANNKIYFSKDGSRPGVNSRLFGNQIRVSATQTIKALTVDRAKNKSDIARFRYVIR